MNIAMFVLIMIIGPHQQSSGQSVAVIQQEFTSQAKCEAARVEIAKVHPRFAVQSQGCYAK